MRRIGSTESEKIEDVECAEAPIPRKTDAPSDGGIILSIVRSGWVEHDECKGWQASFPFAGERIAIAPTVGQHSAGQMRK